MSSPRIAVKVRPGARVSALVPADEGRWSATLKAPPVDGRANEELIALVAAHFGVPRRQVVLKSGATARIKLLQIDAP